MSQSYKRLFSLNWQGEHTDWQIMCQRRQLHATEIRNREFLIGVSLRNPRFSNAWLTAALADIRSLGGLINLCLVDGPYFERVRHANLGDIVQRQKLSILHKQCEEQEVRLRRLASKFDQVEMFRWDVIERAVPDEFYSEISTAFNQRRRTYEFIIEQVKSHVSNVRGIDELEAASVFLQREYPVLIYLYYIAFRGAIDVYPGPQADFFWHLEQGAFSDELPLSTVLSQQSDGLVYADVSERFL